MMLAQDYKNNNKKVLYPLLIAIFTLLILIVGATYAYINVATSNNFSSLTVKSNVPSIGSVVINSGSNLRCDVSRNLMMKTDKTVWYYATKDGSIKTTYNDTPAIATATVVGEGTFNCDYSLNIKGTGDLYTTFNTWDKKSYNQFGLGMWWDKDSSVEWIDFTNNISSNIFSVNGYTYNGKLNNITSSSPQTIKATFYIGNMTDVDQSILAGKSVTFTFSITKFSCTAIA